MTRAKGERGVAAAELVLVFTVLLALVSLTAPFMVLFYERVQLGRTAGDVVRFATSRADQDRTAGGITVPAGQLPSADAVRAEGTRAHAGRTAVSVAITTGQNDPQCPSTRRTTIELTTTVDVGPFAGLILSGGTTTLVSRATSCEE